MTEPDSQENHDLPWPEAGGETSSRDGTITTPGETQSRNVEQSTAAYEALKCHIADLARSNRYLEDLLEATDVATVFLDRELRIKRITPSAKRLLRLNSTDLNRALAEISFGIDYPEFVADVESSAHTVQPARREIRVPDGWYVARILPYLADEESGGGVALTFLDITEQKQAEREIVRLAADSERVRRVYETVLTNTPDFVYVLSLDYKFLYANNALLEMWGLGRENAIGKTLLEIGYEPWHAQMHEREIDQIRMSRQSIRGEVPFNGTHGRRIYDYIFVPIIGEDGEVEAIAGTTRDVTERKQAEESIRLSEARQRFTVRLADALRPLSDPIEVQEVASRLLGEQLAANRVVYFEIQGDMYVVERDYHKDVRSLVGRYPVSSFGPSLLADLLEGRTVIEDDATTQVDRPPGEQAAFAAIQVRGHVDVPLVKGGQFLAGMTVHDSKQRDWTSHEIALIEDTAERTWAAIERVRVEAALRRSEERSAFVRRSSGIGIWYCDLPFDVLQWDDLVKAHFHLPPGASVTIQTFYDRLHPDDREPTRLAMERSIETATPYNIDYRTVNPDTGAITWVRAIGRTFYAEDGTPISFDGVTLDVSERKIAEESLRKSQQRLEAVLLSIDDGLVVLDREWRHTFVSEQAARIVGVPQEEMLGKIIWDLFPDVEETIFYEEFRRAVTTGRPVHFEEYYAEPINKWLECSCYPSGDGLTVYFRDVTERKLRDTEREAAERTLAEERDKLRFMADSMPQKIFTATPDGSRDYFNRQWLEFSGRTSEQLEGLGWADLVHPEDRGGLLKAWSSAIKEERPFYYEYRLRSRDGTYRWHLSRAYPKQDDAGGITLWIGSSTDVDDARRSEELHRERLEREVGIRTEELMRSNEQLQGFTYSVAHDLRQQIRGISVNGTMLMREAEDTLSEESKTTLDALVGNAKRLSALVDDLLTYARLGRQDTKRIDLDLSTMAREVESYLRQSGQCGAKTKIRIAPGLKTQGDASMIRLVLENLMDNACKYSSEVENPIIEIGSDGEYFFVRDNGIGFEMEFVEKLFQPFERLHKDSEYPGTGIGLANVKRIIEKHGGVVKAESGFGGGATFSFKLGTSSAYN